MLKKFSPNFHHLSIKVVLYLIALVIGLAFIFGGKFLPVKADYNIGSGEVITLTPDPVKNNGSCIIHNGGKLVLNGTGDYIFDSINITQGGPGDIAITYPECDSNQCSNTTARLIINGDLTVGGGRQINVSERKREPGLNALSGGDIEIDVEGNLLINNQGSDPGQIWSNGADTDGGGGNIDIKVNPQKKFANDGEISSDCFTQNCRPGKISIGHRHQDDSGELPPPGSDLGQVWAYNELTGTPRGEIIGYQDDDWEGKGEGGPFELLYLETKPGYHGFYALDGRRPYNRVEIHTGTRLTHHPAGTDGKYDSPQNNHLNKLAGLELIVSDSLVIENDAGIDVSGKGFPGGSGPSWVQTVRKYGVGETNSPKGGGGAFGGNGGKGTGVNANYGNSYPTTASSNFNKIDPISHEPDCSDIDAFAIPTCTADSSPEYRNNTDAGYFLGSGGGNADGGRGGGYISVEVNDLIVNDGGFIIADGMACSGNNCAGGAGAGGGISIKSKNSFFDINTGGNYYIRARGGSSSGGGGTGSGGRITMVNDSPIPVYYGIDQSLKVTAFPGEYNSSGSGTCSNQAQRIGGCGTIMMKKKGGNSNIPQKTFRSDMGSSTIKVGDTVDVDIAVSGNTSIGQERPPLDIVFVLDRSASMGCGPTNFEDTECTGVSPNKWSLTKDALNNFIAQTDFKNIDNGGSDRIAIVSFNTNYFQDPKSFLHHSLKDCQQKSDCSASSKGLINVINSLPDPAYTTSFGAGLIYANQELKDHGRLDAKKVIIFLTDGIFNTCPDIDIANPNPSSTEAIAGTHNCDKSSKYSNEEPYYCSNCGTDTSIENCSETLDQERTCPWGGNFPYADSSGSGAAGYRATYSPASPVDYTHSNGWQIYAVGIGGTGASGQPTVSVNRLNTLAGGEAGSPYYRGYNTFSKPPFIIDDATKLSDTFADILRIISSFDYQAQLTDSINVSNGGIFSVVDPRDPSTSYSRKILNASGGDAQIGVELEPGSELEWTPTPLGGGPMTGLTWTGRIVAGAKVIIRYKIHIDKAGSVKVDNPSYVQYFNGSETFGPPIGIHQDFLTVIDENLKIIGDIYSTTPFGPHGTTIDFNQAIAASGAGAPLGAGLANFTDYQIQSNTMFKWTDGRVIKNLTRLRNEYSQPLSLTPNPYNDDYWRLGNSNPLVPPSEFASPEGKIWEVTGPLTIGDPANPGGNTNFTGRGTIIVNGNLKIYKNIDLDDNSMVGFVVLGNVEIGSSVTSIEGAIYQYSADPAGKITIEDNAGQPFSWTGIAVGQNYSLGERSGGVIKYDGNITDNPPPGFAQLINPKWTEQAP